MLLYPAPGVSLFFGGEKVQCPVLCITRSKGGRRASSGLSRKEGSLSVWKLAARLAASLSKFLSNNFFYPKKKEIPQGQDMPALKYVWKILTGPTGEIATD
jgi:hypothetical protein